MKKFILLCIPVYSFIVVHAQDNPREIKVDNGSKESNRRSYTIFEYSYDFSSPAVMKYKQAKYRNDRVYLKLNNVNRLIFDVDGSAQMVNSDLSVANYFDTLAQSVNKTSVAPANGQEIITAEDLAKFSKSYFKASIDSFLELQTKIQNEFNDRLIPNLDSIEYFANFAKSVPSIIAGEKYSQSIILHRILTENSVIHLNNDNPFADFNSLYSMVNFKPGIFVKTIKKSAANIKKYKKQADDIIQRIKSQCNRRNGTRITDDDCDLQNIERGYPLYLEEALAQADKINEPDLSNSISSFLNLLNQVKDSTNFSYLSNAFVPDGDYMIVKGLITPKDAYKQRYRPDSIILQIPIRGKFKWSLGPAINFSLSKSLFDDAYNIDSARNANGVVMIDTFRIKKNKNQNSGVAAIGLMANFYWQTHTTVTPGISLGLSTSTADLSQLRVYLGGSLFIGGLATDASKNLVYHNIVLSAGIAYGQVYRLKGNLIEGNNPKSQVPFTGNTVAIDRLTEKIGKFGLYVGASYRLN